MIAGIPPLIECREQSVPRQNEGEVAPRDKRAAQLLKHSSLGEGLTQRNLRRTILPGCSPQLAGSLLVSMPLHAEVSSIAPRPEKSRLTRHSIQKPYGGRKPPAPVAPTRVIFKAEADPHKSMCPLALLKHARSRASVDCGARLNSVSFQLAALEHDRVSSWSCCRVATQPCWRGFYYVRQHITTREREK